MDDFNPVCKGCRGPSELTLDQEGECVSCLETPNIRTFCTLGFISNIGIDLTLNGSVLTFTAPKGLIFDVDRINGALEQVNAQLPTGSLQGYITQVFTNIGENLSTNARYILTVLLGGSILLSFVFFTIICIILMSYSIINVGVGLVLILIGVLFSIVVFIIVLSESSKFGTNIETGFTSEIEPVLQTLTCAAFSGICCYSGISCCCSGVSQSLCKNPGFPPG